ncbi:MAG: VOC family protein [Planctomycetes bacterium]|nr:VOC family protein [Planctomycetota bacterium]
MHGRDDDGNSQWAVLTDPDGATFGIIPVVDSPADVNQHDPARVGRIAWADLTVADAAASRDFYCRVIGWTVQDVAMDGGSYADFAMLGGDGEAAAGVCHARGVNADLPPVWMIYLPVGDLDESLRRVEAEGGKVVKATTGDDGRAKIAVVQDPVGVFVSLTTS